MKANPSPLPSDLGALLADVQSHSAGLKEFELLQLCFARLPANQRPNLADPAQLFRQHFLLFHQLYRLDGYLAALERGGLDIHTLCIRWYPASAAASSGQLQRHDPLRAYYLDLDNLRQTSEADVYNLLTQFWQKYSGYTANEDLKQEFALFELPQDADFKTIKARFRTLVAQHHPDRGGDPQRCQQIMAAMEAFTRHHNG